MAELSNQGLIPLDRFMKVAGLDGLQFKKGKGRQFCSTPVGVVFMADKFNKDDVQKFITVAGPGVETKQGVSLEGTLWLVNAQVQDGDLIGA